MLSPRSTSHTDPVFRLPCEWIRGRDCGVNQLWRIGEDADAAGPRYLYIRMQSSPFYWNQLRQLTISVCDTRTHSSQHSLDSTTGSLGPTERKSSGEPQRATTIPCAIQPSDNSGASACRRQHHGALWLNYLRKHDEDFSFTIPNTAIRHWDPQPPGTPYNLPFFLLVLVAESPGVIVSTSVFGITKQTLKSLTKQGVQHLAREEEVQILTPHVEKYFRDCAVELTERIAKRLDPYGLLLSEIKGPVQ